MWDILWDIFGKSNGIYLPKTKSMMGKIMGYILGYNWQYFSIIGYIKQKLRYILGKIMGYILNKLWDIFSKPWDLFGITMGYIWQKL